MSFLCWVAGLTLIGRVRNSDIWRELGVELLLLSIKRRELRWFGYLIRFLLGTFLWRFSRRMQLAGNPGVYIEHSGEIIYLIWLGNASGSPRRSWKMLLGGRTSGLPCLACCHHNLASDKCQKMDGWMDVSANNAVIVYTLSPLHCSFLYHPPPSALQAKGIQTERNRSRSESAMTVKTNEGGKWSSCFLFC